MFGMEKSSTTTSKSVLGLGILVTVLGRVIGGGIGKSITGFGLAHVALGALDMLRPTVKGK